MSRRARILWLLLTTGGSGCIQPPGPFDPGALAGRITASSPVATGPPSAGTKEPCSFECDCCQPEVAPGILTPVAYGFGCAEVLRMVRQVGEARRVLALNVAELHPDRDRQARLSRRSPAEGAAAVTALLG